MRMVKVRRAATQPDCVDISLWDVHAGPFDDEHEIKQARAAKLQLECMYGEGHVMIIVYQGQDSHCS